MWAEPFAPRILYLQLVRTLDRGSKLLNYGLRKWRCVLPGVICVQTGSSGRAPDSGPSGVWNEDSCITKEGRERGFGSLWCSNHCSEDPSKLLQMMWVHNLCEVNHPFPLDIPAPGRSGSPQLHTEVGVPEDRTLPHPWFVLHRYVAEGWHQDQPS